MEKNGFSEDLGLLAEKLTTRRKDRMSKIQNEWAGPDLRVQGGKGGKSPIGMSVSISNKSIGNSIYMKNKRAALEYAQRTREINRSKSRSRERSEREVLAEKFDKNMERGESILQQMEKVNERYARGPAGNTENPGFGNCKQGSSNRGSVGGNLGYRNSLPADDADPRKTRDEAISKKVQNLKGLRDNSPESLDPPSPSQGQIRIIADPSQQSKGEELNTDFLYSNVNMQTEDLIETLGGKESSGFLDPGKPNGESKRSFQNRNFMVQYEDLTLTEMDATNEILSVEEVRSPPKTPSPRNAANGNGNGARWKGSPTKRSKSKSKSKSDRPELNDLEEAAVELRKINVLYKCF
jgi:hypothetical protein